MTRKEKVRRAKLASNGYSPMAIRMLCRRGSDPRFRVYWSVAGPSSDAWYRFATEPVTPR